MITDSCHIIAIQQYYDGLMIFGAADQAKNSVL